MTGFTVPLTPWYAHLRGARRRAKRRASHGSWLARSRSHTARWVRGPEYSLAWTEALRRLPSLARLDNAGEFGREVLRQIFDCSRVHTWAENPRTRRWLKRMRAAGIAEVHIYDSLRAPWCMVEDLRQLLVQENERCHGEVT